MPFSYWRKRKNVPRIPASADADGIRELERNLSDYFHKMQGRGENCKVDSHDGLSTLVQCVGLVEASAERVISVLLYYGFEVRKNGEETVYIYDVNYDIEMLRVRIRKWGGSRWPFGSWRTGWARCPAG